MTVKEKMAYLMETGEFDFINNIPKDQFWKLLFFITYVFGCGKDLNQDEFSEISSRDTESHV